MSASLVSVGQLRDELSEYPDNMLVVVNSCCDPSEWKIEGMLGGPTNIYVIDGHEVRTGWNPKEAEEEFMTAKLLYIGDHDKDRLLEDFEESR